MSTVVSVVLGVCALLMAGLYLMTRLRLLQVGPHRLAYAMLQAALGAGCAYTGFVLLTGIEALGILHVSMLVAAGCNVWIGRQPGGRPWHPPLYSRSDHAPWTD